VHLIFQQIEERCLLADSVLIAAFEVVAVFVA
jgi:hypothetical protein